MEHSSKKEDKKQGQKENSTKKTNEKIESSKNKKFNPEDYIQMLRISSGNFSLITMVEHKETKKIYTLKSFDIKKVESLHKERDVFMEKYAMEKISPCPYIVGYYGSSKNDYEMYILYEYVDGDDLWKKSVIYGIPSEKLIKFYFIQLLLGIKHMHSFNIIHRDIKPENVMVTKDQKLIKIIDFGSSLDLGGTDFEKKLAEKKSKEKNMRPDFANFAGTANYMSPECVHNKFSNKKSDIWSLGCVLYNLITGFPPFNGESEYLIFEKSTEAKYIFPEGVVNDLAKDLIEKIIVVDPEKRPTIDEILNHPYLKNEYQDKNFLLNLPIMTEDEKEYYEMRKKIKNDFDKYKDVAEKLDQIKQYEKMDEELRLNDITPEPGPDDEKIKLLRSKKGEYLQEYEKGLKELSDKIKENKKNEDCGKNKIFNQKLEFLETQIKHDIFNIAYKGFEFPPEKDEDESSSSSSDEDENKEKNDN